MKILPFILILISFSSCANLKPYEKRYVNAKEMNTGFDELDQLSNNPKTYREGSQGGNSNKSGGGCGCN